MLTMKKSYYTFWTWIEAVCTSENGGPPKWINNGHESYYHTSGNVCDAHVQHCICLFSLYTSLRFSPYCYLKSNLFYGCQIGFMHELACWNNLNFHNTNDILHKRHYRYIVSKYVEGIFLYRDKGCYILLHNIYLRIFPCSSYFFNIEK